MDELTLTDLTDEDLEAAGLSWNDVTPELLGELVAVGRLLARTRPPPPPADVVEGWHALLATLPTPVAPSSGPATPSSGPVAPAAARAEGCSGRAAPPSSRRRRWGGDDARVRRTISGVAGTLAAAAAALVVLLPHTGSPPLEDRPGPSPDIDGTRALGPAGSGDPRLELGRLADPARLAGCLARMGTPGARVVAARAVRRGGRPAVALVLPTTVPGRLRVLVVPADCGPGSGPALADTVTGG